MVESKCRPSSTKLEAGVAAAVPYFNFVAAQAAQVLGHGMERRSRRHQTISFVQPGKCNIETVAEPKLVTRTSVGLKKRP